MKFIDLALAATRQTPCWSALHERASGCALCSVQTRWTCPQPGLYDLDFFHPPFSYCEKQSVLVLLTVCFNDTILVCALKCFPAIKLLTGARTASSECIIILNT